MGKTTITFMVFVLYQLTTPGVVYSDALTQNQPGEVTYSCIYEAPQIETVTHQIAVCDLICTGTIVSTNDGFSAEMAVEETLWGQVAASNITVRYLEDNTPTGFEQGRKYLILAFTNNWWHQNPFLTYRYPYDFVPPDGQPPVFGDCRLLCHKGAVDFRRIDTEKTNYWEGVRTYITNFIEITKIEADERKAHEYIYSTFNDKDAFRRLPGPIQPDLFMYYYERYGYLPPPEEMYGGGNGAAADAEQ